MTIGAALPGTQAAKARSRALLEEAKSELARGRPDVAATHLKLALLFDPANREASRELDAIPFADRSPPPSTLDLEERRPTRRAREAERRGDVQGAMRELQRGLETRHRAACAHRLAQLVLQHDNDEDRALELLHIAVEAAPRNPAFRRSLEKLERGRRSRIYRLGPIGRWLGRR
ncbi:MAG: hypothetical protein ACFB9M_16915 [Myxococcota bacterium]